MSRKISERRREAFLAAVRATGNQTIAAERAKVSRAWVQLQRSTDPGFKAAVAVAVADARASLSQRSASSAEHSGGTPPSGWGFLDGEELVVKGTGGSGGGKRVQIARARLKQWTARVESRFLGTLAATCNVKAACAEVGMTASSAYAHRKRWPAFARLWEAAIEEGYMRIEAALLEAGCNLFSDTALPPPGALPAMTAADAIQLLHMHKHQVHKLGKAPGVRWRRPPSFEEVAPRILRKVQAVVAAQQLDAATRAADAREHARRRFDPEAETGES